MKPFHLIALIGGLVALAFVVLVMPAMQVRAPLPVSQLESDAARVSVQTCAECHHEIVSDFATAPHANTLRPGSDPAMMSVFAGQAVEIEGRHFSFSEEQNELWFQSEDLDYRRRVDWVFGSGRHALTPISLDPNGMTQLYVSSFADGKLRNTPGIAAVRSAPLRLGNHESVADTRRCFGCHVSRLSSDGVSCRAAANRGRMQTASLPQARDVSVAAEAIENFPSGVDCMVANLDCSRCHFGAEAHAQSDGRVPTLQGWAGLTPLESINRCGECHRRADEMKPYEISVDQTHLIRFAPVGLSMSRCFQVANAAENAGRYPRLDCITCHDPHLPSRTEPEFFEAICRQCHAPPAHPLDKGAPANFDFVTCSQQPLDSACLSCHMPKSDFAPGLRFTDHWIR